MTEQDVERLFAKLRQWQAREHDVDGRHRIAQTIPVGTVMEYAGTAAPSGWLVLDGKAYSRIQYAELFKVIGTQGGVGNDTTTFNVPTKASAFTLNKIIFSGVE